MFEAANIFELSEKTNLKRPLLRIRDNGPGMSPKELRETLTNFGEKPNSKMSDFNC